MESIGARSRFEQDLRRSFSPIEVTITDAVITVVATAGFDVVSVRTVAQASGFAPGTIQYHFPSKQDLLTGAFIRSVQRQLERVRSLPPASSYHPAMVQNLLQLLPVDDERREDCVVWVSFGAAASTRTWLARRYWDALTYSRDIAQAALEQVEAAGYLMPGLTPHMGARLLIALVNGLTIDFINAPREERVQLERELSAGVALIIHT